MRKIPRNASLPLALVTRHTSLVTLASILFRFRIPTSHFSLLTSYFLGPMPLSFDETAAQLHSLFFICSVELKRAGAQSLHRQIGRERHEGDVEESLRPAAWESRENMPGFRVLVLIQPAP